MPLIPRNHNITPYRQEYYRYILLYHMAVKFQSLNSKIIPSIILEFWHITEKFAV